jgi:hypothetical protein
MLFTVKPILEKLTPFIESNTNFCELKRSLTVQMWLNSYKNREIQENHCKTFDAVKIYLISQNYIKLVNSH